MKSEIESRAKFDIIRYAQVWEDADLLIDALNIKESDTVLSIASAGDNAFSLLAQSPQKVYAVDLSFAQIACCELRRAMYRQLSYEEHLVFGGVTRADAIKSETSNVSPKTDLQRRNMDRLAVFKTLELPQDVREYWENNIECIETGFMTQGKFERYFALFRRKVLPLVHSRHKVAKLIEPKTLEERRKYYDKVWDNFFWRLMFSLFFSRFVMGRLGRDKEFFKLVEGSVADRIKTRAKHALTELDTSQNPYLHFILNGEYIHTAFPYSLRRENYDIIRDNIDRIEFSKISIEQFIAEYDGEISAFNLSDIFEYMTQDGMDTLYETMLQKASSDARFAYWNMLVPRRCSRELCQKYGVETDDVKNAEFLQNDKAFFYSKFYLDMVRGNA